MSFSLHGRQLNESKLIDGTIIIINVNIICLTVEMLSIVNFHLKFELVEYL